jgi:hypothetical protein
MLNFFVLYFRQSPALGFSIDTLRHTVLCQPKPPGALTRPAQTLKVYILLVSPRSYRATTLTSLSTT